MFRSVYYFSELPNPPPFSHALPGAAGYVSTDGRTIVYGKRPDFNKWKAEQEKAIEEKILGSRVHVGKLVRSYPTYPHAKTTKVTRLPKPQPPPSVKDRKCEICDAPKVTRHHVTPKLIRRIKNAPHRGIRYVCRTCHTAIHEAFDHEELVAMDWDEVLRFMKANRPLTH